MTTPIGALMRQWLQGRLARREITPTTADGYRRHLNDFADHVGNQPITSVTTSDAETWLGAARKTNGQPLLGSSLNTRSAPIKAFFTWATANALIPVNPFAGIARAKTPHQFPQAAPKPTIRKLLLCADHRQTTIIMLALHLGLRRIEISRLNIESWDRDAETMRIWGKGDKQRVNPVSLELAEVLELWTYHLPDRGPMFPSQAGGRISPDRVGAITTQAARRARVKLTTHTLRHTFASELVMEGVPLPTIQQLLGHSSLATTTGYVTASGALLRDALANRHIL